MHLLPMSMETGMCHAVDVEPLGLTSVSTKDGTA